ncbi:hypothetical protein EDD66_103153 [Mobilisporobacter senegalensis]|uniref:Uncharacterized protein n=1 Tax=Mobilisporobacter senegalensis TaxID=1329262 RepID=A0A3N1XWA6_9FIRM|nr:hypothetical protein [Mobilisporobacter senegalensis]ROR29217.1 hypothetical protein EDD66_103153 [Mobilisporobacter senegalensis]
MKKFLHFGIVASVYIFIYVICRQFFFIGKPYHLYTPDWTAKNILLIAAIISTAPALIGWKRYPYITVGFYSFGIVLGELFGSQMVVMDHNLPPMPYHYGFAWCIGTYAIGCVIGLMIEKITRSRSVKEDPKWI